jgi:ribosomal protein L11 methyltransferase
LDWLEVKVVIHSIAVEAVSDIFTVIGSGGVVIEEHSLREEYLKSGVGDYYDLPELQFSKEHASITGYLLMDNRLTARLEDLRYRVVNLNSYFDEDLEASISTSIVKEEDWETAWKAYYKPEKIGERIVIKPTWEPYEQKENELIVELDPGMAFGTGSHPTTSMCVEFLDEYLTPETVVLDVGTGSGILAIVAAKLGANKVIAVDLDPLAVKVAKENVIQNKVETLVEVLEGNLLDKVKTKADLVVANIIADIIIAGVEDMVQALADGGHFLASGIIDDRRQDVEKKFAEINLKIVEVKEQGGWVAILAQREA